MSETEKKIRWITPLIGALGGGVASLLHWPLPWMTGALLFVIAARCLACWPVDEIPGGRRLGQWVVAIGIGLHFTPDVLEQILAHWALILLGGILTTLPSLVVVWWLCRNGEPLATAFFSSMPGSSAEMVNFATRNGADVSRVAASQSVRVLVIVLCVPALFRYFANADVPVPPHSAPVDWAWLLPLALGGGVAAMLWRFLRQPNPWFFGPLLVSATASVIFGLNIRLPDGANQIAQLLIGSSLGCYFDRAFFTRAPAFLVRAFLATVLLVAGAACVALILSRFGNVDTRSMILGTIPGGITEMSLTADALRLSVPLVTALQMTRLLLVLFFAEPLYRCWHRLSSIRP